jgi:hypothetical protein
MMTMAGSGCLIDHAETLIAITRSICELTEAAFSASPPLVVNQAARVVNPMPTCSSCPGDNVSIGDAAQIRWKNGNTRMICCRAGSGCRPPGAVICRDGATDPHNRCAIAARPARDLHPDPRL